MDIVAREIKIEGVVQGVGFRPFVFRLATEYGIRGWVLNSSEGVTIWAEAPEETVLAFYGAAIGKPPKLALIVDHRITEREVQGFDHFFIKHSEAGDRRDVMISPDVAVCEDCYREIRDSQDRRYRYPFTNCTNCGPRFTIIMDVPYDRVKTTMRDFPMCPVCAHEFEDPMNRRFHAVPNACPACGPQVTLSDLDGRVYPGLGHEFLISGHILAVKGLGGFHLICDARCRKAVANLRRRKIREFKPFAVMCRDLQVVEQYCHVSPEEAALLETPAHPIVILDRRRQDDLPPDLAPGIRTLGVMLPYTPLHHLLFEDDLEILVATSANISDDPLIIDNDEALVKLKGIADYFLMHNRQIYNRCDDSVATVVDGEARMIRRARAMCRCRSTFLDSALGAVILGCGGELKGTFCLTKGKGAYLSQHLGDLNHYGNYRQFLYTIPRFETMLDVKPEVIAYDLHPDYIATRWAKSQDWTNPDRGAAPPRPYGQLPGGKPGIRPRPGGDLRRHRLWYRRGDLGLRVLRRNPRQAGEDGPPGLHAAARGDHHQASREDVPDLSLRALRRSRPAARPQAPAHHGGRGAAGIGAPVGEQIQYRAHLQLRTALRCRLRPAGDLHQGAVRGAGGDRDGNRGRPGGAGLLRIRVQLPPPALPVGDAGDLRGDPGRPGTGHADRRQRRQVPPDRGGHDRRGAPQAAGRHRSQHRSPERGRVRQQAAVPPAVPEAGRSRFSGFIPPEGPYQ